MIKLIKKYKNTYLFLTLIALIGLISGYLYYELQSNTTKSSIIDQLDIKENLNTRVNNLPNNIKNQSLILIKSTFIIPIILNIITIFYKPFEIGFLYNALKIYNTKFSLLYITIYKTIPFIITIILTRLSISITINIIRQIFNKKLTKKHNILNNLKKYILILILSIIYETIIIIISPYINSYLMTFLKI